MTNDESSHYHETYFHNYMDDTIVPDYFTCTFIFFVYRIGKTITLTYMII
jgi:hypothetical protein